MSHWGIRARVMFLALLPSVMIMLALVTYFTSERIDEVESSLARRGSLVAQRLMPETEFALFAGDRAALQRLADAALAEADVSSVTIRDAQGRELAHGGSGAGSSTEALTSLTQPVFRTRLATTDFPEQSQADGAPAQVGQITVTMSRTATRAQQRRLLLIGLALGSVCLFVAIALALVIGNGVIRPIRRLASAMVALGRGQELVQLTPEGGGEFRTLGEGFNRMAARLRADAQDLEAQISAATHALVEQKDAAEQATKAKSRFIAAASHDLRQPLHAIGLFTATLQRRAHGTELQAVVDDMAKAVQAMDRLLHSLLDISRLDAGSMRADPRPIPLDRLFAQLAAEYADAAQLKRLRLHVVPTDAIVVADEVLLHRILSNLVANAIRYTNAGTVAVCCRWRAAEVQVEVRDSGIGIAQDQQAEIFHEFVQIGSAERDQTMGLGLGLAIVSRLARLMATKVDVRSAPGRGSVFALRLRRGAADLVARGSEMDPMSLRVPGTPLLIVAIDDDPLVLAGNRALLEELGCEVITVADGDQALAVVAALGDRPVLVLCDMWLADGRNGIEALRRLSALAVPPIAAILVSGDTRPETLRAASEAGYPLLHKPVSPAKLRAIVMHYAWKSRKPAPIEPIDENPAG